MFLQHLADRLLCGWDKSYSHVLMRIRLLLAFAIIQAINYCFCGSCVLGEDGAGLPNVFSGLIFTL